MIPTRLTEVLREHVGATVDALGTTAVESAVRRHASERGLSEDRYVELLCGDDAELQRLLESLLVSESWFFRDHASFELLVSLARERPATRPLRVLSIPCATGEEPYSIVIALLRGGCAADLQVDAWDLSGPALDTAARGRYGPFSFRDAPPWLREEWFTGENPWDISPTVRARVTFAQHNALHLPGQRADAYDFIFCRNLLIYLEESLRTRVIVDLLRMLRVDGALFVGVADRFDAPAARLQRIGSAGTFAYRRQEPETAEAARREPSPPLKPPARPHSHERAAQTKATSPQEPGRPASAAPREARAPRATRAPMRGDEKALEQARLLADRGVLGEAHRLCLVHTQSSPLDPAGYRLLGVVLAAMGDLRGADATLRRALYLDGKDDETLTQASLVAERLGDLVRAQALRKRRSGGAP